MIGILDIDGSPYQGYLYAYPHKTSYRALDPRPRLEDVWADEDRTTLFLYVHIPFCEMRCGFCNLFTRANAPADQVTAYLAQLRHQAGEVAEALGGQTRYNRAAIGGGTPTYLEADELRELFAITTEVMGAELPGAPLSVETSPATATPERLAVLREFGTTRISIGVQSFLDSEARAAGRPQRRVEVDRALGAIRDAEIPQLNIDLIYGIDGQTPQTWQESLETALSWSPEELYLYPLYVRPLTGLGRRAHSRDDWDAQRLALYRQAVEVLSGAGYVQESMRQFRRPGLSIVDDYSCQDDGMVGIGCGARSYTRDLHYSFDYAVGVTEVRAVLDDYLARPAADFAHAEIGFRLDDDEQRRRWLLKSLLRAEGVDAAAYERRFGRGPVDDFPSLRALTEREWMTGLRLTAEGLGRSDAIGPWLTSPSVRERMDGHVLR